LRPAETRPCRVCRTGYRAGRVPTLAPRCRGRPAETGDGLGDAPDADSPGSVDARSAREAVPEL